MNLRDSIFHFQFFRKLVFRSEHGKILLFNRRTRQDGIRITPTPSLFIPIHRDSNISLIGAIPLRG